jgi:hypothetical protein
VSLYTTGVVLMLTIVANVAFINMANAFHRKWLYKNITLILLMVACVDIVWSVCAAVEVVHDAAYYLSQSYFRDTIWDQYELIVHVRVLLVYSPCTGSAVCALRQADRARVHQRRHMVAAVRLL